MPLSKFTVFLLASCVLLAGCSGVTRPGETTSGPSTDTAEVTQFRCPESMQPGPPSDLTITNHRSTSEVVGVTVVRIDNPNDSAVLLNRSITIESSQTVELERLPSWDVARTIGAYQLTVSVRNGNAVTRTYDELGGDVVDVQIDADGLSVSSPTVVPVTLTCTPGPNLTAPG